MSVYDIIMLSSDFLLPSIHSLHLIVFSLYISFPTLLHQLHHHYPLLLYIWSCSVHTFTCLGSLSSGILCTWPDQTSLVFYPKLTYIYRILSIFFNSAQPRHSTMYVFNLPLIIFKSPVSLWIVLFQYFVPITKHCSYMFNMLRMVFSY